MQQPISIKELHNDESLRQKEFPVTQSQVFLAHAAVCPLPRRVTSAIQQFVEQGAHSEQELGQSLAIARKARGLAAKVINVTPEEIALVGPTSLALSYVASGFPFKPGDNVITYFDDYPSNVYPWAALDSKGVQVKRVQPRHPGQIGLNEIKEQIDSRTKLVALASCHFLSGYRIDLEEIGNFLKQENIAFCVDAIQTVGAFPTPGTTCDFLAADAHKWMLGPCSAGILYVNRNWQDTLKPTTFGWHNVRCPDFVAQEDRVHPPDARRYEAGSANLIGLVGMIAALELLLEIGIENIAAELTRKRQWLLPALKDKGYTVLHESVTQTHSAGIITLDHPEKEMAKLHQDLTTQNVIASIRSDRAKQNYLRLSPHFYNTDAELEKLINLL